ncbi:CheW protein [Desulfomicrobium apsheronum]|jgi:purine-binding chemotaxis protein CheW|uniref:CheW protein n=3 Tax=Desulfomicrobium TaxID=898 RepID=A0A1I3YCV2_9BACT|nr:MULTISPECIES: chemotaxis protein CheW [Desulfomicrobium]MBE1425233.1 purine-binding chemotaxis protein CheW [Desulfomicrobium macestii]SFK29704.1 CheW protein [Desulfomicrobium apsheronum]SFL71212.1 purine-binding chemotaxis protein CheW [Desulfomicrobium norvegicum]
MSDNTTLQYLTFGLGEEVFALETGSVREVIELVSVTRIPKTPPYMRGVINLRGHAVPVVDLRIKFDMPKAQDTVNTCIIIVDVEVEGENCYMGAIVDSVREVFEMTSDQINPPPRMGTSIRADFIRGMGKQNEEFIMILDIGKVFSPEELQVLRSTEELEA